MLDSIKSDDVRRGIRGSRVLTGVLVLGVLCVILGLWSLDNQRDSQQSAQKDAKIATLAVEVGKLQGQREGESTVLDALTKMEPTPQIIVATPTPIPTPKQTYRVEIHAEGNRAGDEIYVRAMLVPGEGNANEDSVRDIISQVRDTLYLVEGEGPRNYAKYRYSADPLGYVLSAREGIPEACFDKILELGGRVLDEGVPPEVVAFFEENALSRRYTSYTSDGVCRFAVIDSKQERLVGVLKTYNLELGCLAECARSIGWDGNPEDLFAYDLRAYLSEDTFSLYEYAASRALYRAPRMPNLCWDHSLYSVPKPDWLEISWEREDTLVTLNAGDMKVRIDRNPTYPNESLEGTYLVESQCRDEEFRTLGFITPGTLIQMGPWTNSSDVVALTLTDDKGRLLIMQPVVHSFAWRAIAPIMMVADYHGYPGVLVRGDPANSLPYEHGHVVYTQDFTAFEDLD